VAKACCALIFLRTYHTVPLCFFTLTLHYPYFSTHLPAVPYAYPAVLTLPRRAKIHFNFSYLPKHRSKRHEWNELAHMYLLHFNFHLPTLNSVRLPSLLVDSVYSFIKDRPKYPGNSRIMILIHDIRTSTSPSIQCLYVRL